MSSTSQHPTIWEQLKNKHTAPGAPVIPAGPYDSINRPPGEVPHGQASAQISAQTAQTMPAPTMPAPTMQAPAQNAPAPIAGLPSWLTVGVAPAHPAAQMSGYPDVVTMTAQASAPAVPIMISMPPSVQAPNVQAFAQSVITEMTAQAPQTIVPPRAAEIAQTPAVPALSQVELDRQTGVPFNVLKIRAEGLAAPAQTVVVDHVKPVEIAQAQASTPIAPPAQAQVVDRPPTTRGRGFVLLDGCVGIGNPPWGGTLVSIAPLLRTAATRAAQAMGVPDYRMADYGKGAGAFVALLEQVLDESGLGEGDMVVLDMGPESDHARATLQARASYTIRGTR